MTEWTRDHWIATSVLIVLLSALASNVATSIVKEIWRNRR